MKYLKYYSRILVLGILAGISIGIGSLAFVAAKSVGVNDIISKLCGSALFSLGLLAVCSFGFYLYTGKIGYAVDNKPSCLLDLLVGFIGNFIGAFGFGYLCSSVDSFRETAYQISIERATVVDAYNGNRFWYINIVLGIICGILVFIAVDIFKKKQSVIGLVGLILAVTIFVFVGSEHCIANIAYFSIGNCWNASTVTNVFLVAVGNSIGSILFRSLQKLTELAV